MRCFFSFLILSFFSFFFPVYSSFSQIIIATFASFKADGNRMQAPEAENAAKFGRGLHTLPRQPKTNHSYSTWK